MSKIIHLLNGPNLNRLGTRDIGIYGPDTLSSIEDRLQKQAAKSKVVLVFRQTNHEGQMIDWLHEAADEAAGLIINAGAWTHDSIAIRDAVQIAQVTTPIIELHLSNIHAREAFRSHSHLSPIARGIIVGFGPFGYELALTGIIQWIRQE